MITRDIVCKYCGRAGRIEVPGSSDDPPSSSLFRFLGHNPVSGHMHYRCPACRIVLLVEPMAILTAGGLLGGDAGEQHPSVQDGRTRVGHARTSAWLERLFHVPRSWH